MCVDTDPTGLTMFMCVFQLLQITRKSESDWETKSVLPVSFASLVVPEDSKGINMVDLGMYKQ